MTEATAPIDPRSNNFNLLRLIAASSVIFSHASEIAAGRHDVLAKWIGYSGGWIAVSAFFSISGMLIYRSMVKSRSVRDYAIARSLRIFPGLWVMLVISVVVLGLFSTHPPAFYFADHDTYTYVLGNGILYAPQYSLPGVFEGNTLPEVINGSLWTLRFEFTCYIAVLVLFLLRAYRSERAFVLAISMYALGYFGYLVLSGVGSDLDVALFDGSDIAKMHRLSFAFVLGMIVGRYLDRLRINAWMVAISGLAAWTSFGTAAFTTLLIVCIAVTTFWFAFLQTAFLFPLRRMHDYSYGIYIYAFPVQQCVVQLYPELSTMANAMVSLMITVPLAAASWYLVEKPALGLKARIAAGSLRA